MVFFFPGKEILFESTTTKKRSRGGCGFVLVGKILDDNVL